MASTVQLIVSLYQAADTVEQGRRQESQGKRAAETDEANARGAERAAKDEAGRIRRRGMLIAGTQRAQRAASGGQLDTASFSDIQSETFRASETEALNVIFKGQQQSMNFLAQAERSRFQGKFAKNASFGTAYSILGGGNGNTGVINQFQAAVPEWVAGTDKPSGAKVKGKD